MEYIMGQIQQLGLWSYIQKYPVNPVTIVVVVFLIGVLLIFMIAAGRRRRAGQYMMRTPGAALLTFHKKNFGNTDYADNIRIVKLNGETAHWFFVRPMIPAIYLKPGENKLELHADWARSGFPAVKMHKSESVLLTVTAKADAQYSLEYYIPESRYIVEPFVLP